MGAPELLPWVVLAVVGRRRLEGVGGQSVGVGLLRRGLGPWIVGKKGELCVGTVAEVVRKLGGDPML